RDWTRQLRTDQPPPFCMAKSVTPSAAGPTRCRGRSVPSHETAAGERNPIGSARATAYALSHSMDGHFLAFDLGAESGRAMSGRLRSGVLDLTEICRFPNEPIREHASMHWDLLRLWREMQRALERLERDVRGLDSIGVDAWGCDYGLPDERG